MAESHGQNLTLYHGTSVLYSDSIERNGLQSSSGGCLGCGVYLACLEKARNFALDAPFRQKGEGAVVFKVNVLVRNPKYITGNDEKGKWRTEGHDSVCTNKTQFSRRPEWCIADPSQCKIVSKAIIYYGNVNITDADFKPVSPPEEKAAAKNPTCPGRSNWGGSHPREDGVRVQCPHCGEYRCSNCIPVHLMNCRGRSVVRRPPRYK